MPRFIVDRDVLGLTAESLAEQRRCLQEAALRASRGGEPVRYLRCTVIPDQDRCLDLFEADSAELVRQVNDTAQMPYRSIGEASEDDAPGVRTVTASPTHDHTWSERNDDVHEAERSDAPPHRRQAATGDRRAPGGGAPGTERAT